MSNCLSIKCNNCPIGFICDQRFRPNGKACKRFEELWKKTLLRGGHSTELGTGDKLKAEIAAAYNDHVSHCNTPEIGLSYVILMNKLRKLSAV
jgi:hypothetical protein